MCGIAGFFSPVMASSQLESTIQSLSKSMTHRGPDHFGVYRDNNIPLVLTHFRLSIHDLSPNGHQPMCSSSGRYVIVFNGEIYNFKKIRSALPPIEYRSRTDTEILLESIEHFGLNVTLSKIDGMFAFALYDRQNQELVLVRDRVGEKPLFYAVIDDKLIFSSEMKGLFSVIPASKFTLDRSALQTYLRYGYISAPQSIFLEVKKINPGHYIKFSLTRVESDKISFDHLKEHPYWSVKDVSQSEILYSISNKEAAVTDLDRLLNEIISDQHQSDVPVGSFLSGGVDSSLVSAILQSQSGRPIDTFTIGFNDNYYNEAVYAKEIAKHIGSKHNELYIDESDLLGLLPEIPKIYDEPFSDSSQIPMIAVCRHAKRNVTVCLSGDGGDELFIGYNRYIQVQSIMEKFHGFPSIFKLFLSKLLLSVSPARYDTVYKAIMSLLDKKIGTNFGLKVHKFADLIVQENYESAYQYLCSYAKNPDQLLITATKENYLGTQIDFEHDFLRAAMEWDQLYYLPGDNLVKTDRASMAASLEVRLPLLDRKLIDFSWKVDPKLKYFNKSSKWLLKQVLYKYVPKSLIERPKMGFTIPIGNWLNGKLKQVVNDCLNDSYLIQQNIFNPKAIKNILLEHQTNSRDHGNLIWTILVFQLWYRCYIEEAK
jgi:asparagine synthase (glutamine-hydrolysing)